MNVGPRAREWGLAVDFGTTATAAVTVIGGDVSLLSLDGGGRMSSSVYASGADGVLLVGKQADNEAGYAPERYEPTPKRQIDRPSVPLGDRRYAPVELIAAIMAQVLSEALAQHNGSAPAWLVLTHPVAWSSSRRQVLAEAMQAAARQMGVSLPDPVFVAEPVAAAQWYALGTRHVPPEVGQKFAVYDLGGGTFDVAILERTERGHTEVNRGAIDPLGGYDFDSQLFTYLGNRYIAKEDADLWRGLQRPQAGDVDMAERQRQMRTSVQYLKEQLSRFNSRTTQLRGVAESVLITRDDFEDLIVADVDRTIEEFLTTLDECGLSPGDLAIIYRVGGASRIPLVGRKLEALGAPVHSEDDPKLVVAKGAALTPEVRSEGPPPPPPPDPTPDPDLAPDPDPKPVVKKASAKKASGKESAPTPPSRPWWRHPAIAIPAAALVVIAVLVAMGIVPFMDSPSSDSPPPTPTAPDTQDTDTEGSGPTPASPRPMEDPLSMGSMPPPPLVGNDTSASPKSCTGDYSLTGRNDVGTHARRGSASTSCLFTESVLRSYWRTYGNATRDLRQVSAPGAVDCRSVGGGIPCDGPNFVMDCQARPGNAYITCTGGRDAVVYLY